MHSLDSLGWSPHRAREFEPHDTAGLVPVRVSAEHKELYHYLGEQGEGLARVTGRLRHEAQSRADFPAVGDWVALSPPTTEGIAIIHAILPRLNKFSRKAPGRDTDEQILAANLDTLFLVTSFNRDLNPRRIERYLAAASVPHLQTVILLNKSDLQERPGDIVEQVRSLAPDSPVHAVSAHTGDGLAALGQYLQPGRTVALVGSSGVGKSTLLNRLLGDSRQSTQTVREDDDRGRHTTTHRELIVLPQGGLVIDNPGLRELQLWDEEVDLDTTFQDVAVFAERCRFPDCSHTHEPGCAVQDAIEKGLLPAERMENYQKLERETAYLESRHNTHSAQERKARDKRLGKALNKWLKKKRG